MGKSNLLSKYRDDTFQESTKATIGVDLSMHSLLIDGKRIQNQIWDTAGQERFRAITSSYYRSAVGVIIVFDLTKKSSFLSLSKWLGEVRAYAEPETFVMVVGNKSDLAKGREVSVESIEQFTTANRLAYTETSALDGSNVQRAFESLIEQVYQLQKKKPREVVIPKKKGGLEKVKLGGESRAGVKNTCC